MKNLRGLALRGLVLGGCLLALAGCTGSKSLSEVNALNQAQAVGSPFTQNLAAEYRDYANAELKQRYDYPNALHFARKGLAAASGEAVLPEPISDWNLLPEHMNELSAARARLLTAYDLGAREVAPKQAAIAQVRFDCWIEQQEQNWDATNIKGCKSQFLNSLAGLENTVHANSPPPPAPPVEAAPPTAAVPMKPEDAMYLVFFDFDKSDLTSGARNVLDSVVSEIKSQNLKAVHVVGNTDTSGPRSYNQRLSLRRGNAVRDYLTQHGVDSSLIDVQGRGEDELLVKTPDGVREPANRRAQITFE